MRRADYGFAALAAAAVVAGVALRVWQLDLQVLVDDEWHALHKLLRVPPSGIFASFGYADHSIPLTLYFRFLHDHVGLSEWAMHAPTLVAGSALLVLAPWLARAWATPSARALWVALLAVSPLLVHHSRLARPYALTSLLTFVAFVAYWRWRETGGPAKRWAATYALSTIVAGWLHPITLPFTLAPFLVDAVPSLLALRGSASSAARAAAAARLRRVLLLGALTLAPLAVLIGVPLAHDWTLFAAKAGKDWVTPASLYRTALMLCGTREPWVAAAMIALGAWGAVRLVREQRALAIYLGVITLAGFVATVLAQPRWVHHPLVLARYLIPALPILLLCVALGADALLARVTVASLQPIVAAAAVVALVAAGPLPLHWPAPTQFGAHLRYQFDYVPEANPYVTLVPRDPVPEFYRRLATLPPRARTLVEAPWRLESNFNPHPWYQEIHRQDVRIGLVTPVCGVREFGEYPEEPGMRLRHFVHLTALLRGDTGGADYLVVHLAPWKTPHDAEVEWPDMTACLPQIEARFGAPVFADAATRVYALTAERRRAL